MADATVEEKDPQWYRDTVTRQTAEIESLRHQLLESSLGKIGLDAKTGIGKAVVQTYKGKDFTEAAIATYAQDEYGHVPPTPVAGVDPASAAVTAGQAEAEKVPLGTPAPAPPADRKAQILAEVDRLNAEGKVREAVNLKATLLNVPS